MSQETISGIGKNIEIPDHSEHLKQATSCIISIKKRLNIIITTQCIDDKSHSQLYDEVGTVLFYVGQLSQPLFDQQDNLENEYKMRYLSSPALGKKLYWQHYENLHHPYSLLKNRCYKLFNDLDAEYIKHNDKKPPNWRI